MQHVSSAAKNRSELVTLSLSELQRRLRAGSLNSHALTSAFLDQIDMLDGKIGAFLATDHAAALAAAAASDRQRESGIDLGPLMGIPIAVKDLLEAG